MLFRSISAYDMAISDAIYGPTDYYVSRHRLQSMLDYEYDLLLERLDKTRGGKAAFFVFADTVATHRDSGHGWLGVRFQAESGSDPSEIIIHVRMLDKESVRQQEALALICSISSPFLLNNRIATPLTKTLSHVIIRIATLFSKHFGVSPPFFDQC